MGPGFQPGLPGGRGEVFGVQVEGPFPGRLSEVFSLVAEMAALFAGAVLTLVPLGERAPASGACPAEDPSAGVGAVLARPAAVGDGASQFRIDRFEIP